MDTEDRIQKLESNQSDIKDALHGMNTSIALINQSIETLKTNQQKIIDRDTQAEEKRKGTIRQLWMFGAGGLITTFISWLARVSGLTG